MLYQHRFVKVQYKSGGPVNYGRIISERTDSYTVQLAENVTRSVPKMFVEELSTYSVTPQQLKSFNALKGKKVQVPAIREDNGDLLQGTVVGVSTDGRIDYISTIIAGVKVIIYVGHLVVELIDDITELVAEAKKRNIWQKLLGIFAGVFRLFARKK